MFTENSTKIIMVDKQQAADFLKLNTFESQRKINTNHLKKLEREIEGGTFRVGEIATAIKHYNGGEKVLINGQHQAQAIINTGTKIKAVYEVYDVFTPTDLSLLFRKFDNNFVRTLGQKSIVEAKALGVPWSNKVISLMTSAVRYKTGPYIKFTDSAIDDLRHYLKVGDFVNSLFEESEKLPMHLTRGPVVHAILLTWEKSQSDTERFWKLVRDGESLKKSDPAFSLRDYLLTTSVGVGRGVSDTKRASQHEMVSKCVTAWNAYRKGTKTDLKYYSIKPIPKAV